MFIYSFKSCLLTLMGSISKKAAYRQGKEGSNLKTLFEEGSDSLEEQWERLPWAGRAGRAGAAW